MKLNDMLTALMSINLQIFATQTTLLEGLSVENKTYYDMKLIDEASPNLVYDQFGQKRPIPANGGKTIEFRKFAPLAKATTPLTEGVTPDGKSLSVSTITATVNQYGDFVTQTDVLELTSLDNTILEATKLLGRQAGLTLDTIVRDVLNSGTNVTYCPKVAADGAETAVTSRANLDATSQLTVKVIQQVVAKLRGQNAPTIGGKYVAIIHPYVAYDLMRDPEWIDAHKYANPSNLYEGEIGEIAGVRFVQTTEAKVYEGGVFSTLFLGEGAYGVTEITGGGLQTIVKQKGSAGTADPLDQRSSVGWKAIKTAEILIENYLVRVESKSAVFSATTNAN
jgi:N4-gp56 family major capsid protein